MATRQEYEMLFKLGAQVGQNFNKTFSSAQKVLTETQKEIAALNKMQGDISAYTKQQQSITDTSNKLTMYEKQLKAVREEIQANGNSSSALANKEAELEYKVKSTTASLEQKKNKLNELGQSLENAGVNTSELSEEARKLKDKVEELKEAEASAGEEAKVLGEKSENAFSLMGEALVAAGIAKGLEEIVDFYKESAAGAATYADTIGTLSLQYGIAAKDLQAYTYAAELLDVDVNTITASLAKNTRSMNNAADGSKQYVEAYKKLGVSIEDTNGNLKDAQTVYWEVIDALSAMSNETERDGIAMTLLGRNAMELNTLIKAGPGVMKEYTAMAEEAGYIMSKELLNTLCALDDQEQIQQKNLQALKNTIGATLAPELIKLKEAQNEILVGITDFASEHPGVVKGVVAISGALSALLTVYAACKTAKTALVAIRKISSALKTEEITKTITHTTVTAAETTALNSATVAQQGLNAAMSSNAIGVIITLVASFITLLIKAKEELDKRNEISQAAQEYAEEAKKAIEETKQLYTACEEGAEKYEIAADVALSYTNRLKELEAQGIKTVEQQKEYASLVERIKAIIPDLNLEIDSQTGLLKNNASALEDQIKAQKKLTKQTAIKDYALSLEKQQLENIAEIRKLEKRVQEAVDKFNALGGEDEFVIQGLKLVNGQGNQETYDKLKIAYNDVISLGNSLNELSDCYLENERTLKTIWGEYDLLSEATDTANQSTVTFSQSSKSAAETILHLAEAYESARSAAEQSIAGQYKLWDTASIVIPEDIEKINTALETQAAYWSDYKTDLDALKARSSDFVGLNEILATFADGSAESVNVIAGLAEASDEEIKAFIETYNEVKSYQKEATDALLDTMLDMENAIESLNLSDEAEKAGRATIDAYINALKDGTADAATFIENLALILSSESPFKEKLGLFGSYYENKYGSKLPGYANGTSSAARGWAMTGENGPELIYFNGGETVYNAKETSDILSPSNRNGVTLTVSPQFYISASDDEELSDTLEQCKNAIVQDVLYVLQEAEIDKRRGAYA